MVCFVCFVAKLKRFSIGQLKASILFDKSILSAYTMAQQLSNVSTDRGRFGFQKIYDKPMRLLCFSAKMINILTKDMFICFHGADQKPFFDGITGVRERGINYSRF